MLALTCFMCSAGIFKPGRRYTAGDPNMPYQSPVFWDHVGHLWLTIRRDIHHLFFHLIDFRGRTNIRQFWFCVSILNLTWLTIDGSATLTVAITPDWSLCVFDGLACLFLFPLLVRRLHDINCSGWWCLSVALPLSLSLIFRAAEIDWFEGGWASRIHISTDNIGSLNFLLFGGLAAILLAPGTDGPNRYGDAPDTKAI